MNKKTYNAPATTVVEMEASSIMAGSPTYNEFTTGNGGSVDFGDGTAKDGDAGTARISSNQYFDAWSDDEEM